MKTITALLAIALAIASASLRADELQLREALKTEVKYHLDKGEYDQLQAMYEKIVGGERFPSGVWKLAEFYCVFACIKSQSLDPAALQALEDRSLEWRKRFPDSNAAQISQAYALLATAWRYRGEGPRASVSAADWEAVGKYATKAYGVLQERGPAVREDPEWYNAMFGILVLHRKDEDEFPRLLREGMAKHPDYQAMYFGAAYIAQPQWLGSWGDIEKLAQSATQASAQTEGKSMYARIYWHLNGYPENYGKLFQKSLVDWPTMRASFEDLVARYPDPWNLNAFAWFACNARDGETVTKVAQRIGTRVEYAMWDLSGRHGKEVYDGCVQRAGLMVGETGSGQVSRLEDLPEPRRTLNLMIGGMERRVGLMGYVALLFAFTLGFVLRAARMNSFVAWIVASIPAPVVVLLPWFQSGRSGYKEWALIGALVLGSLLAAFGVALAQMLFKRTPIR